MHKIGAAWKTMLAGVQQNQGVVAILWLTMCSPLFGCGSAMDSAVEENTESTSEALSYERGAAAFGCSSEENFITLTSINGFGCQSQWNGDMTCYNTPPTKTFLVYAVSGGKYQGRVALSDHVNVLELDRGRFVSADQGGGRGIFANRSGVGGWETFTAEKQLGQAGLYSLRTDNDSYVTAEQGGGNVMNANRPQVGPWERFHVECRKTP